LYNIPMQISKRIERGFFAGDARSAARRLLGTYLVRVMDGRRIGGMIVECEAYRGEEDLGCHAKAGLTPRTRVMYGPPGHAYVYFTYGMHWMLNFVVEAEGFPAAVLVRAIAPLEGIDQIAAHRSGRPRRQWTDGPGKVCQALAIDRSFNGADLCTPEAELFLEEGAPVPDESVTIGPRVGLNNVPEPWKSIPWRFRIEQADISTLLRTYCPVPLEEKS
jgi:DNA-3-methyladenine glycosylase